MKTLRESLLDVDNNIDNFDENVVVKFIKDNFWGDFEIVGKVEDGKYGVCGRHIRVTNNNLTSITNGMFVWVDVDSFDYGKCKVTSLKDMPLDGKINAEYLKIKFDSKEIAKIKKDLKEIWKKYKNKFDWVADGGDQIGRIEYENYEITTYGIWIDDLIQDEYGDPDDWEFEDFAAVSDVTFDIEDPDIQTVTYCGVELDENIWKNILKY